MDEGVNKHQVIIVASGIFCLLLVVMLALFAFSRCSGSDDELVAAPVEDVEQDVADDGAGSDEVEVEESDEVDDSIAPKVVEGMSLGEFSAYLEQNAWIDAAGTSTLSFSGSTYTVIVDGESKTRDFELVEVVATAEKGETEALRHTAKLKMGDSERELALVQYDEETGGVEAVIEQITGNGQIFDPSCMIISPLFDTVFYRQIDASSFNVVDEGRLASVFGDDAGVLVSELRAYCAENLPNVTEVAWTGEAFENADTGQMEYVFACNNSGHVFLLVTYDAESGDFVVGDSVD